MDRPLPLSELVRLAGGQSALADRLGCTQGNISQLLKRNSPLPARFVLAAETALAVPRERIRPDLFGTPAPAEAGR
jgi:DNA-binding transcriptional regulator YdaS (Cro superfamily)